MIRSADCCDKGWVTSFRLHQERRGSTLASLRSLLAITNNKEHAMFCHRRTLVWGAAVCLAATRLVFATDEPSSTEPNLTDQQKIDFLLNAKVIDSRHTGKGVTDPWKLTLNDGTLTHFAVFQSIDEHKMNQQFDAGTTELNFVDSYKYNIAGYDVAKMLGLDDLVPIYVERKWKGDRGSIGWWVPVQFDEGERTMKRHVSPPDPDAWNKQMYRVRVLDELLYDTDPNLTNVLITPDWHIWRIDFTRAFRQSKDIRDVKNLQKCDRKLFENLKKLDGDEVLEKTKPYLSKSEVKGMMARRDKIVDFFNKQIAKQGEDQVLY